MQKKHYPVNIETRATCGICGAVYENDQMAAFRCRDQGVPEFKYSVGDTFLTFDRGKIKYYIITEERWRYVNGKKLRHVMERTHNPSGWATEIVFYNGEIDSIHTGLAVEFSRDGKYIMENTPRRVRKLSKRWIPALCARGKEIKDIYDKIS